MKIVIAVPYAVCPLWWRGSSIDTVYTLYVPVLYWCSSASAVRVAGTVASGSAVLGYTSANAPIPSERAKARDVSSLLSSLQVILPKFRCK